VKDLVKLPIPNNGPAAVDMNNGVASKEKKIESTTAANTHQGSDPK